MLVTPHQSAGIVRRKSFSPIGLDGASFLCVVKTPASTPAQKRTIPP